MTPEQQRFRYSSLDEAKAFFHRPDKSTIPSE
jgi:hypothetical protein